MLFTRCPECDTTFRVTDETLKKAHGQVRCGRCASVFNAYAELHDPTAESVDAEPEPRRIADQPAAPTIAAPHTAPSVVGTSTARRAESETVDETMADVAVSAAAERAEAEAAADAASVGGVEESASGLEAPISATEVERVLTADAETPLPQNAYTWSRIGEPPQRPATGWTVAAALALLALGAQAIHHFRADIAGHPTFGPWLTASYEAIGVQVAPSWDVHQYQIIDWVATAEPNSRGLGSLKITARIQNRGPLRQPYPAVQLRLKDRWETAVGSRMFTPAEYLPRDTPHEQLMSPGETARAEIEVVDPGPDAYGFELDVCIEVEASLVTCGTDAVFL